jgi:hypothetical protein
MTFEELARIVADPSFGEDALIARLVEINGFGGGDRDANFAVVAGETVLGRIVSTGVTRKAK